MVNIIKFIKKLRGVVKGNLTIKCHLTSISSNGIKQYLGKHSYLRTESKGRIAIGHSLYVSERCIVGAYNGGILHIGDNNFFNVNCNVTCLKNITIGDNNLFGPNVVIVDHNHKYDDCDRLICRQGFETKSVSIGSDCWICANVVITPGSYIGSHIVVASNAVVTGKLEIPGVYAGIPAKLIKRRGK